MTTFQSRPPGMPPMRPIPQRPAKPQRNVVGIIALVCAIGGFVFSCIPGALIVGWVLLPIGFVLGLVGLCLSGQAKGTSLFAVIVSIVGTIVAVLVFSVVVVDAFDDAFGGEVSVSGQESENASNSRIMRTGGAEGGEDSGTRENPAALGQVLSNDDWDVTVNGFTPNATDAVLAANSFNESPAPGFQYALVDLSATYKGDGVGHGRLHPRVLRRRGRDCVQNL